jgi:hypothetical protein
MAQPTASGGFQPIEVPVRLDPDFRPIEVTPVDAPPAGEVLVAEPKAPRKPRPAVEPEHPETADQAEKEA